MALTTDDKKAIIAYRIQKAKKAMIEAQDNAKLGHWNLVANRLYYAVFHLSTALLIDKGYSTKSHAGVICVLGQEFVIKGLLDKEDSRLASRLLNMRQAGDYDDLFDWTDEDILPLFPKTEALLSKLEFLIALRPDTSSSTTTL